jgi:nitrate/TMAO reductase-like tetraheme cytochrome c subunit
VARIDLGVCKSWHQESSSCGRRCAAQRQTFDVWLVDGGFFSGVFFWGGFNTAMEATNTMEFCISCHEMRDNVYQEYKKTIHYTNRTGVRAMCSDCHVPKDWTHKMVRKVQASAEVWGKLMGTIDTRKSLKPTACAWPSTSGRG